MRTQWSSRFYDLLEDAGVPVGDARYSNGWLEELRIADRKCFLKSASYISGRREYFAGVDTSRAESDNSIDQMVLCGGSDESFRDLFILPWGTFQRAIQQGEPVNTYKDRQYSQYKVHFRFRDGGWLLMVQGGTSPTLDANGWRYSIQSAIGFFKKQGHR